MSETKETTASETKQSTFSVSDPFDSDPGADVVLISCDNAGFRVRKAILSFISPVFSDMFSLPQPMTDEVRDETATPTTINGLPFVNLPETGEVIDTLLQYGYPLENPGIIDAFLLFNVIDAAEKYDMKYAISGVEAALSLIRHANPEVLLFLYRRACNLQMEVDARQHAFGCLNLTYPSIVKLWGANTSFGALSNLIDYHQAVSVAISEYVTTKFGCDMWGPRCGNFNCAYATSTGQLQEPWWAGPGGLHYRAQNIIEEGPMFSSFLPTDMSVSCRFCSHIKHGNREEFEAKFRLAIREEANRVSTITSPCHDCA